MSVAVLFVSLWRGWPPRKQLWRGRPSSQAFGQRQNAAGGNKNEAPYWRVRAGARPYRVTSPRSPIGIRASRRAAAFSAISATAQRSFALPRNGLPASRFSLWPDFLPPFLVFPRVSWF